MTNFPDIAFSAAGDAAAATAPDRRWVALGTMPSIKVRRISGSAGELAYSGEDGDVTLRLAIETDIAGVVTDLELVGFTAEGSGRLMRVDLRSDTSITDNHLTGITCFLSYLFALRAAEILDALNDPDLLDG